VRAALAELGQQPARVEVWEVDPGYVAGEETAAVNAINGRPAKPSDKPPRPFEEGVRGLPTLVSNEIERLRSWCGSLPGRGACGTLDGAVNIARSLLREFPGEVDSHLRSRCARCAGTEFTALTVPFAAAPDAITPDRADAEEAVL
jgi:NADH:ubiquinone oxidoreductase subunit F (NADH-binding)